MSHQTGITANEKLLKVFGKAKDGKIRAIKVSIENEQLTCAAIQDVKKDWEKDYDRCIVPLIEENIPCYILYRLDKKTSLGSYGWLLLSYIPDTATIRQKMLYASTKATLKIEFGSSNIQEELHATQIDETTYDGYLKNKKAFSSPAPLTTREEELQELKKTEINTDISTETRHQTLAGINFPLTIDTIDAIKDMLKGSYDYLQFQIDLEGEKIQIVKAGNIPLSKIPDEIPADHARYHIYLFKHNHEGDYLESYIFIYSMPGYSCSVKERMMYSSCKAPFLDVLKSLGMEIAKKLEISEGSEITDEFLRDELHPKQILHRPQFAKPKGPPNRGAKRLTKPQQAN